MSRQRYVVVGIIALAAIVGISLSHLFGWIWAQTSLDDFPLLSRELSLTVVLGYSVATLAAVFCFVHKPTVALTQEVADELSKVSWPSREETGSATVVVLATVVICATYLGLFDAMWLWLTNLVLGVHPSPAGQ
ncbi:MAG: preprotein translocase subunit SecE [Deltaproteobacteria bacterium]|nr:preprotein translocase subunit SecE [Deltaproteobacteria bacterium]